MFDLGWPELLVIAIVLIVVVGPKDLPGVLRGFGRTTGKLRSMAGDFRKQFDEALREAELDDVKTLVDDVKKLDPRNEIRKHLDPLEKAGQGIRGDLDRTMKPKAAPQATPAPAAVAKPAEPRKAGATALPGEKAAGGQKTDKQTSKPAPKPAAKKAPPAKAAAAKPAAKKAPATKAAPQPARGKKTSGTAS